MPSEAEAKVMAALDFNVARSTVTRHLRLAGGDVRTAARCIHLERLCEEEEEGRKQWLAAQRLQREVLIRTRAHCGKRGRTRLCASSLPWRACSQYSPAWILQASRDLRSPQEIRAEAGARWARRRM